MTTLNHLKDVSMLVPDMSDSDSSYSDDPDYTSCLLHRKYILVTSLGNGADGAVWLAFNLDNSQFYAIKIINAGESEDGLEEVNTLKKLGASRCRYINKMVEHFVWKDTGFEDEGGSDGGSEERSQESSDSGDNSEDGDSAPTVEEHVCMVFELHCGSVYDVYKKGKYSKGFPFPVVVRMVYQLLKGMECMNNEHHMVHTDIKPDNLLLVGVSNKVQGIIDEFNILYGGCGGINNLKGHKKKSRRNRGKSKPFNRIKAVQSIVRRLSCNKLVNESCDSDSEDSSDTTTQLVDDRYLDPSSLTVKLSDFCNSYEISDSMDSYIQTVYYRAPEIILDAPFTETCDVWSVGCTMYELLTGKILFDPAKTYTCNRDREHLYSIQCKFGPIPQTLINRSHKQKLFYRDNGLLRGKYSIKHEPLSDCLTKSLTNKIKKEEMDIALDFLYQIFKYDPAERPNVTQCLQHALFNGLELSNLSI